MARPYDHAIISQRFFFPLGAPDLPSWPHAQVVALDGGVTALWSRPLDGAPTVLYLHGNGECIADQLDRWPEWTREAGANVMFVDYPGYAASAAAGDPTFSKCRAAAHAALEYLLAHSAAPIVAAGRSAGSVFAADAAAALADKAPRRLAGLILESAVADLFERLEIRLRDRAGAAIDLDALRAAVRDDFDQRAKLRAVAALGVPVLVLHTQHDQLVSVDHGERLARWAGDALAELVVFDVGDHNSIQLLCETPYRMALRRFLAPIVQARADGADERSSR